MAIQYHCLISGLLDLHVDDQKVSTSLHEIDDLLKTTLSKDDYLLIQFYLLRYDNKNLLDFLKDENSDFEFHGNCTKNAIEEFVQRTKDDELNENEPLIPFWYMFIDAFLDDSPVYSDVSWENQLTSLYYEHLLNIKNKFIKNWYEFELTINNILLALNCRKFQLDYDGDIIGSNKFSVQIRESNAKDFNLTGEFEPIEELIKISDIDDPLKKEREIDKLKWNYLDEHTFFHYFTIEKVFAYFVKFDIISRWAESDTAKGKEIFKELLENLKNEIEFPEEFTIQKHT